MVGERTTKQIICFKMRERYTLSSSCVSFATPCSIMNVRGKMWYQVIIVFILKTAGRQWEFEEVMNSTSIQLDQFKKITVRVQSE